MRAHEAGWAARRRRRPRSRLAARARRRQRGWCRTCGRTTAPRTTACSASAACRCPTWSPSTAPRRTSWTRPTSAPAPAPSATLRRLRRLLRGQGVPVHRRWRGGSPRRGSASTSARPASSRSPSGPGSTRRGSATTATTRRYDELRAGAGGRGRPDRGRLLRRDRPARAPRQRAGLTARVMVRVTAGVEAHTHEYIATAHEDQKFGFSITSGDAFDGGTPRSRPRRASTLLGLHCHIGWQIFDTSGFEVAARRVLALHARISAELGVDLPELDLGGGFGIAYTTQDDPADAAPAGHRDDQDRRARVPRARRGGAAALDRARPGDRRAGDVHRLRGRHRQAGRARRRRGAHLRLGRRRDERQHPHRALRRRLLLHPGLAGLRRDAGRSAASSASTARPATSSSRTSSCPATSPPATCWRCPGPAPTAGRWPATTTTPCVRPWSRCATGSRASSYAGRLRTTCWRPT